MVGGGREIEVTESRLTLFLLGAVGLFALTFYLGVLVGRESRPEATAVPGAGVEPAVAVPGRPPARPLPKGFIGPPPPALPAGTDGTGRVHG
jgi:hypothetical protein